MDPKMKKIFDSLRTDFDLIFNDVENKRFSSDTITALSCFYDTLYKLGWLSICLETTKGLVAVSGEGVIFSLHGADDVDYFFCAENKTITKRTFEVVKII
jgi:hypothetical protein